jgi:hypothetical protein
MEPRCQTCRVLLGQALDLCVRARKMDAIDRRASHLAISQNPDEWQESGTFDAFVADNNAQNPHRPIATKSATVLLWMQEQYDLDLADWEARARNHLTAEFCEEEA